MELKREGAAFVGAKKLSNGGVVFNCKDDEAAIWLSKGQGVMPQFLSAMGGTYVFRPRRTELIAEMVSVETRIEDEGTWRLVERDGGFKEGAIVGARWVKAPARRAMGQRVAHLKIDFADDDAANHAI
ncbi:hypothetical protein DFH06DRAFT_994325, partial [Mycena polygramma]